MNNLLTIILISSMLFAACENKNITWPGNDIEETPSIEDYYPFTENTKYVYEGEGNEFAYYTVFVDYVSNSAYKQEQTTAEQK